MRRTRQSHVSLPPVPDEIAHLPVAGWAEPIWIDTYLPADPSPFPEFFDSRVYQASSGRVFPLPFHEEIVQLKAPHRWEALHLENEYVRIVILPELGGRIYVGYDKISKYDFFYRNNVIKPALVGLAGPWLSGGVEFNWPQHHRPATFLPMDWEIRTGPDGSVTAWCSDHDPFARMKGMHGIRLRPGSSLVEARVRLYNRTELTETFLWWANVAAAAGDDYQAFFPTDVQYVADHGNRALTTYPRAQRYYGVDYASRAASGDPDADRIDWYRNIPVPTSYMVTNTRDEFMGGYDHGCRAGFVHIADRLIAPGKKLWTWGDSAFGRAWNANLTDDDPPYVELMSGVFSRNQPDFSFLAPGETKCFSQYWYPIHDTGTVQQATENVALHLEIESSGGLQTAHLVVITTRVVDDATVALTDSDGRVAFQTTVRLTPAAPLRADVPLPTAEVTPPMTLTVTDSAGWQLIAFTPPESRSDSPPPPAVPPPAPVELTSTDSLYLTGRYLEQYRHATRRPEPYWRQAVALDPADSRSHLALAESAYRRHRLVEAEEHVRVALGRMTQYVPNPESGAAHYLLGLILARQHQNDEAEDAFGKAAWNADRAAAASYARAKLDARRGDLSGALAALSTAIRVDRGHLQAAALTVRVLRAVGDASRAEDVLAAAVELDPLDQWLRHLRGAPLSEDAPKLLDVALEYAEAGFLSDALDVLEQAERVLPGTARGQVDVGPLIRYHRARILDDSGDVAACEQELARVRCGSTRYCQASRLADVDTLEWAVNRAPTDTVAQLLLGNWHYAHRNADSAVACWKVAAHSDDAEIRATALRDLAIATYNVERDRNGAAEYFHQACEALPDEPKLLYESDQLDHRLGVADARRLARLEAHPALVARRDDLTLVRAELLTSAGRASEALELLARRQFQPWEGGEGRALAAWEHAQLSLARAALGRGDADAAIDAVQQAIDPPTSLGEARHPLANAADLYFTLGEACAGAGDRNGAEQAWSRAASFVGDFTDMSTRPFSAKTIWSIRALIALGRIDEANAMTRALCDFATDLSDRHAEIDFFATSLPHLLLFHDDPDDERIALLGELRSQLDALAAAR